jgi:putative DNA primase/helicase
MADRMHQPCPKCGGHDRFYRVSRPKHGGDPFWNCNQCSYKEYDSNGTSSGTEYHGSSVSLSQAEEPAKPTPAPKPRYDSLAEYAQAHGLDVVLLAAWGWQETRHNGHLCFTYPTTGGTRRRYADETAAGRKYDSPVGYHPCWYGLAEAVALAAEIGTLVLTNGEISTIAAQARGIPACAVTSGEKTSIPPELLEELRSAWDGPVLIALDCDATGRRCAAGQHQQLTRAGIEVRAVDLGGSDGFDLADFCRLYDDHAVGDLFSCPDLPSAAITTSAMHLSPGGTQEQPNPTDMGNGIRFIRLFGETVRYVHTWGAWYIWNGSHWAKDETNAIHRMARQVVRSIYAEASRTESSDTRKNLGRWALSCESVGRIAAMIEMAKSEEQISAEHTLFDKEPWLLNCKNGTINLRTGELRRHDPADYLTKRIEIDYDSSAHAPTWERFLARITNGDTALADYLQRAIGYTLTGDTSEQCLFFLHGDGSNGKSTFFNAVMPLLGPYYGKLHASSLLKRQNEGGVPNDIAALMGIRMVVSSEMANNQFDEEKVKDLTGNEPVSARFMRAEWFRFTPEFKIWLYGNTKPRIRGMDHGIWRRIRLIPFTATIPDSEKDPQLSAKLRNELPGILAWAVRGCLEWQRTGLITPECVRVATEGYRDEMDTIGAFLSECCVINPKAYTPMGELYNAYTSWCEKSGERALAKKNLGLELDKRGYHSERTRKGFNRHGIGLLSMHDSGERDPCAVCDPRSGISKPIENPHEGMPIHGSHTAHGSHPPLTPGCELVPSEPTGTTARYSVINRAINGPPNWCVIAPDGSVGKRFYATEAEAQAEAQVCNAHAARAARIAHS